MSNLDQAPAEIDCEAEPGTRNLTVLEPREVPLGGPRAMTVRRTLPQRQRSLIGAWCFLDHYGPNDVSVRGGMDVPPHPHIGLQTVSWLFAGGIEHHDSSGGEAIIYPGDVNLMTAGHGIQHSEVSTLDTTILHGVQLWTALPSSARSTAPMFEKAKPPALEHDGAVVRVFLGSLLGYTSPITAFTPIVGAQVDIPANTTVRIPVDASFEHGVLVDTGAVTLNGEAAPVDNLSYLGVGVDSLEFVVGDEPARMILIGGEPFQEKIIMWWNLVANTHEAIVEAREAWQEEAILGGRKPDRFGTMSGYKPLPGNHSGLSALPAPEMPTVRLKPREQPPA